MGRIYAGILGPVAFATILGRSLVDGAGVDGTVKIATACLFLFAGIGYVAGSLADLLVRESVRSRLRTDLGIPDATAANRTPARTS